MCHRVLCYGDSNTYGYDPRSYLGERYPESVRWTSLLEQQEWQVFNQGENGRSIPQREWELKEISQMICRLNPTIVTIMLGSNDLLQAPTLSAEDCSQRMERFLRELLNQTSGCEFLLIAPPPIRIGAWVGNHKTIETSRRLAECYEAAADRLGIYFADAGAWDIGLSFDGVHFSEAGHLAFAEKIDQTLRGMMQGGDTIEVHIDAQGYPCP